MKDEDKKYADKFWMEIAIIYGAILMGIYFLFGETAFYIACGLLAFATYAVWWLFIRGKK